MNSDILTVGSTVKNHISLKTVFEYSATRRASFRSWFLACQSASSSSSSPSSTSMTPSRQEINHPTSSSSSSTSPTTAVSSDSETRAREDLSGIDSHPAPVSSSHVERTERDDPLTKPTKYPKPYKTKTTRQNGAIRCILIFRNGCKNSEKISWMTEILNAQTHTPVLVMNHLQSPRLREVGIWVNTVLKLTSLKTEIARSVKGPKSQGSHAEDALAEPYLVQKILVT